MAETPHIAQLLPHTAPPVWAGALTRLARLRLRLPWLKPAIALPLLVVAILLVCACLPGWIAPFQPTDMDSDAILEAPSLAHWMGTDHFGRDVLSLLIWGARPSLLMGGCTVVLGLSIGGVIGLLAGYAGGIVDTALMRLIDLWMSVPEILLAIVIATALGASFSHTLLAVGVVMVPRYARVMRSQVLAITRLPYIEASRSIGASHLWILLRHVLPHTLSPMLVMATLGVPSGILIGAALSFIGLGVIDDRPDWGFLLSQGRNYVTVAWWFSTFPGLAITATVIAVNMLRDALRNRLDPRLRAR